MTHIAWAFRVGLISCLALICSCDRETGPQPPNIFYGQQECDYCSMIISDDRFAAALIIEEAGEFHPRAFDDIDCMVRFERDNSALQIAARYVKGMQSKAWLDAESATFLHSNSLQTPMASGLCASGSASEGRELLSQYSGELLDWNAIRNRDRERKSDVSSNGIAEP